MRKGPASLQAPPTAELEPLKDGAVEQTDEQDMGMTYEVSHGARGMSHVTRVAIGCHNQVSCRAVFGTHKGLVPLCCRS